MGKKTGFYHYICHPLAKEFQKEKIFLSHESTDDFYKSQWQTKDKSLIWLIYRWIFAIIFSVAIIASFLQYQNAKWFIYLTNWGFALCTCTGIFGAVLATIFYCGYVKIVHPWVLKIYWASYWTALVLATVITLMYWTSVYPNQNPEENGSVISNLAGHAFNSILMILDHMLVAFPSRILHFIYPLGLGLIYALFTLIYYYAGGLDLFGKSNIYPTLDWSTPGWAVLTTIGCFFLIVVFSFIHFGLFKLRTFINRSRTRSSETLNV